MKYPPFFNEHLYVFVLGLGKLLEGDVTSPVVPDNHICFIFNLKKGGRNMGVMESILTALFCIFVVFVVLACLLVLIKVFSFAIRNFETIGKKME